MEIPVSLDNAVIRDGVGSQERVAGRENLGSMALKVTVDWEG